jgi:hypothetical protein
MSGMCCNQTVRFRMAGMCRGKKASDLSSPEFVVVTFVKSLKKKKKIVRSKQIKCLDKKTSDSAISMDGMCCGQNVRSSMSKNVLW